MGEDSGKEKLIMMDYILILNKCLLVVVVILSVSLSAKRTAYMVRYIKELDKVICLNLKLSCAASSLKNYRKSNI